MTRLVFLAAVSLLPALASAQASRPQRINEVVFNVEDVIEGTGNAPDAPFISVRGPAAHGTLIRVRSDFKDKALASAAELRTR